MIPAQSPHDEAARPTLADRTASEMLRQVLEGAIPPGSRLPSERELCEEFDVARTSVREAIQGLTTIGMVERRGNRAYVARELPAPGPGPFDDARARVRELFEVRRVIEPSMVAFAASRATAEERDEIRALAAEFEAGLSLDEFRRLDRAFHWVLARASHSALLAEVYTKVLVALFDSEEWMTMLRGGDADATRRTIDLSGDEHRWIAERVADADAAGSLEMMSEHLRRVEDRLVAQLDGASGALAPGRGTARRGQDRPSVHGRAR